MIKDTKTLSRPEIFKIVNQYIGVEAGYLGDFSYQTHHDFYLEYCGIENINPYDYEGTTRERFIQILSENPPHIQAKILEGVLKKYPLDSSELRTQERFDEIKEIIDRLKRGGVVATPVPKITSQVVTIAINDAETLLKSSGATSGVDRIHTALHGYLQVVCDDEGIVYGADPGITDLFKLLKTHHQAFQAIGSQAGNVTKIMRSSSAILDALNPMRNRGSVAHPNQNLLDPPEAMLFINVSRTILHYVDMKIEEYKV